MQGISKILMVFLVGFTLAGLAAIGLWYMLQQEPAQQLGTGGFPGGSVNTATYPNSGSQPPQATAEVPNVPDTDKLYTDLFRELRANKVSFSPMTATGTLSDLYGLYTDEIALGKELVPAQSASLRAALVDVTYDSTPEVFVYEDVPGFCGSGGCRLVLYKKEQGTWHKLLGVVAENDTVGVSTVFSGPYADLLVSIHGNVGSETVVMQYGWDGARYAPKKVAAVWSGNAFRLIKY